MRDLGQPSGVYGFASAGGRNSVLRTNVAQFPASHSGTFNWATGIDAVFFTNSGPADGWHALFSGMSADPTP